MQNLAEEAAAIARDIEQTRQKPQAPILDLSNLRGDAPECVKSILEDPPNKSEFVNFNKVALHLATWLKDAGYTKHGALGIVDDFLKGYTSSECVFRAKPATDSDRKRPLIPIDSGHPFRSKAATL
jgi:hypothetical protein